MSFLNGPGRYNEQATRILAETHAALVVVMVLGGDKGNGFAVQGGLPEIVSLPTVLRQLANSIERQIEARDDNRPKAPIKPNELGVEVVREHPRRV